MLSNIKKLFSRIRPIPLEKKEPSMNPNFFGFKKWVRVMASQELQQKSIAPTQDEARHLIQSVNHRVNSHTYRTDGLIDYWMTPRDFYRAGGGDCEDFAIAKYYALTEIGFRYEMMEIGLVIRKADRVLHAILLLHDYNIFLDLNDKLRSIDEAGAYYEGVYAINHRGWRLLSL